MPAPATERSSPSSKGRRTVPGIGILAGFLPWIVFGLLSWAGQRPVGVACALTTSLAQNVWRARRKNLKSFELATLAFLVIELTAWLAGHGPWFERWGTVVLNVVLGATAIGTIIARRPFTWQYARDDWPEPYWRDPLFLRTNDILTALWAAAFLIGAVSASLAARVTTGVILLRYVVPNLASAAAAVFSLAFPAWYPRKQIEQTLRARSPHRWPIGTPGRGHAQDVVVIGGGMGALASAALLARGGVRVTVVDRNPLPGGSLRAVERPTHAGTFRFHPWPGAMAGLGSEGAVTNLLRRIGLEGELKVQRVDRSLLTPEGSCPLPAGSALAEVLAERFPQDAAGIRRLLSLLEPLRKESIQSAQLTGGVPAPSRDVEEEMYWPATHPLLFPWQDRSFAELCEAHVKGDQPLALLFMMGNRSWEGAAQARVGSLAPELDTWLDGPTWLQGGPGALAAKLAGVVVAHGGRVLQGRPVSRIRVMGGRASYVKLSDGEHVPCGLVLSGIGARATQKLLRLQPIPPLEGRLVEPGLRVLHAAIDAECGELAHLSFLPHDPMGPIAIARYSNLDPGISPSGTAVVSLAAPGDCDGDDLIEALFRHVPSARGRVIDNVFERQAGHLSASAPPVSRVPGLMLVGRDIEPGDGVASVVVGATLVADRILAGD